MRQFLYRVRSIGLMLTVIAAIGLVAPSATYAADSTSAKNQSAATGVAATNMADPYRLKHRATEWCLTSDYDKVHSWPCAEAAWWELMYLPTGGFKLRNTTTDLCLANADFTNLLTEPCTKSNRGAEWTWSPDYINIWHPHTGRYLNAEYNKAFLSPNSDVSQQWWLSVAD
jgi:Ricin-type beta-trefoil lectin domain